MNKSVLMCLDVFDSIVGRNGSTPAKIYQDISDGGLHGNEGGLIDEIFSQSTKQYEVSFEDEEFNLVFDAIIKHTCTTQKQGDELREELISDLKKVLGEE